MTSILAANLFLKTRWRRFALVAFAIPLAILRNGFRILVIGLLCVNAGPQMIHSLIHRRGGAPCIRWPFLLNGHFACTLETAGRALESLIHRRPRTALASADVLTGSHATQRRPLLLAAVRLRRLVNTQTPLLLTESVFPSRV